MPITDEFQEAMLEAQAEIMEAVQEFQMEIGQEELLREMLKVWVSAPDDVKEQFKADMPREYAALMKQIQGDSYAR